MGRCCTRFVDVSNYWTILDLSAFVRVTVGRAIIAAVTDAVVAVTALSALPTLTALSAVGDVLVRIHVHVRVAIAVPGRGCAVR